jgi:hypothetical protein
MKTLTTIFAFLLVFPVNAAVVKLTGKVNNIRIIHWADDRACVQVENNWFLLDLSTEKGKASYSLALTTMSTGKDITARWLDTSTLQGGCDTGTTMYPLYSFSTI